MSRKRTNALTTGLERIGRGTAFALRVIRDAFRAPFELAYVVQELADQGWQSLPLIVSSGLALGMVMTLTTGLERIGRGTAFALRVIRDAFRAPFELAYVVQELA